MAECVDLLNHRELSQSWNRSVCPHPGCFDQASVDDQSSDRRDHAGGMGERARDLRGRQEALGLMLTFDYLGQPSKRVRVRVDRTSKPTGLNGVRD